MSDQQDFEPWIAIVGMACRIPGANSPEEFWANLCAGRDAIESLDRETLAQRGVPEAQLQDPDFVPVSSALSDPEYFDPTFFGYSPAEAALIDPQQRILLECAWDAVERSGIDLDRYEGRTGVFAGVGPNWYAIRNLATRPDIINRVGIAAVFASDKDFAATRIAHALDLRGPAVSIQTACSTSLVAIHYGIQSLLIGECDMALVGASSIRVPYDMGYQHVHGGILSPTGRCRAFDAQADGTVPGSGAAVVALKRLADAVQEHNTIIAVIRGSAINNDGRQKSGFSAPSVDGQADVIRAALEFADVEASSISYVETHGTGTALGDPIEILGLSRAFAGNEGNGSKTTLGAVKTNIGHLDTAAGLAGLIKTALSLQHAAIPPTLHFQSANPNIGIGNTQFSVGTTLTSWPRVAGTPRRAGVSSFGIGGTNAHVIVEEAPINDEAVSGGTDTPHLLLLSARSVSALDASAHNLAALLDRPQAERPSLTDMAYTLAVGRRRHNVRRFVVATDGAAAAGRLRTDASTHSWNADVTVGASGIVFMFSGQGGRSTSLSKILVKSSGEFRRVLETCFDHVDRRFGVNIRERIRAAETTQDSQALSPTDGDEIVDTALIQPVVFSIGYALACQWKHWRLQPAAMIGHSLGEYVAACLAGVFSLEDALDVVVHRGRAMARMPTGRMLAVGAAEADLYPLLSDDLAIAAVNSPVDTTVAGAVEAIAALQRDLDRRGIGHKLLDVSRAFHSPAMASAAQDLEAMIRTVALSTPAVPFISCVTGDWIKPEAAVSPGYWAQQVLAPVRFEDGLATLRASGHDVFVELGVGRGLAAMLGRQSAEATVCRVCSLTGHVDGDPVEDLLTAAGTLWAQGVAVDIEALFADRRGRRVVLPTYPFERRRIWIEPGQGGYRAPARQAGVADFAPATGEVDREGIAETTDAPRTPVEEVLIEVWQSILGLHRIGISDDFEDLGGDSLIATRVTAEITTRFGIRLDPKVLLTQRTIAALAEGLIENEPKPGYVMRAAEINLRVGRMPVADVKAALQERKQAGTMSS